MKSTKLSRAGWLWLLIGTALCMIACVTYTILFAPIGESPVLTLDQNIFRQIPVPFLQGVFGPFILIAAVWAIILIISVILFIRSGVAYRSENYSPKFARNGFVGLYDKVRYYDYKGFAKKKAKQAKKEAKGWSKKAKKQAGIWAEESKDALSRFGVAAKSKVGVFGKKARKSAQYATKAYLSSDAAMKATCITVGCAVPLMISYFMGKKSGSKSEKTFFKKSAKKK